MPSPSLLLVLEVLVGAVGYAFGMAWLERSRSGGKAGVGTVLRYPWSILALGTLVGVPSLVGAVLSFNAPTGGPLVSMGLLGFVMLGAYLTMEYCVVRFEVLPEGLAFRTLFGRHGVLEWQDVSHVSWKSFAGWFVLTSSTGRSLRVSAMLRGLPAFANGVLNGVPRDHIQARAAVELEAAKKGILPTVC